ncbi:signal transduction histidine kinase [Spinactinospora alkalitolerans]|uniref:histidine kinase n=1 Tax=Spinactinospora alkalitolerans TaxID=687207 RepID=A0A852TSK0_9ACTN|nr:histidine kinase [Spinactinospora alkalitolerans]NYE47386.1 signal transduction histidine kinase [Spinactinospora alkalitolerans]
MRVLLPSLLAPLYRAATYTRWIYLIILGAVFLPYLIAGMVAVVLLVRGTTSTAPDAAALPLAVGVPTSLALIAATALVPTVRSLVGALTADLMGGPLRGRPVGRATTWGARARTAGWLLICLPLGFAVCLATMVVLPEAAVLIASPLAPGTVSAEFGVITVLGDRPLQPPLRPWAPLVGLAELAAFVYLLAGTGAALARLAPRLLGPSAAERLAAAQARADSLLERNRLARELHDAIGHALSVVALQAGAAARVLDTNPAFARQALEAIAEQARTATAELDHVLGLLREERTSTAPQRTLADLPALIEATRAAGARITSEIEGETASVPGVVSREIYRVCQEGLTNALRHAGRVPVTLRLAVAAQHLEVEITNPCATAPGRRQSGGRGLAGITERIGLLGGTVSAGHRDGSWRLAAAITWKGR